MGALARIGSSPSAIAKVEAYLAKKDQALAKAKSESRELTGELGHTMLGGLAAFMFGAYYGRTDGYRVGPVDAGLAVSVLGLGYGLFMDGAWGSEALTVSKQGIFSFLTLMGHEHGVKWKADAASKGTTAGGVDDSVRGRNGRTLSPDMMAAVVSRLS